MSFPKQGGGKKGTLLMAGVNLGVLTTIVFVIHFSLHGGQFLTMELLLLLRFFPWIFYYDFKLSIFFSSHLFFSSY